MTQRGDEKQISDFFLQVSKRIVSIRLEKGWSQEKLAEKSGIERVAIGYIEQGRRQPTLKTIYRISRAFGMSPSMFLDSLN